MADPEYSGFAARSPRTLWIELTSTCPYDCVFCSRKLERGAGQHMSFGLYRSLIEQLDQPEVIRLNYSGESIHYPHLGEAIRLARGTGATTELVTALSSAPPAAVRSVVEAGLDRLSISLHTSEEDQYREIYRFGSLQGLRLRLAELRRWQAEMGTASPEVDFAFVAMENNLGQLPAVAALAQASGAKHISVHPVIRRNPELYRFPAELESDGSLRSDFSERIHAAAEAVAETMPEVTIAVARPRAGWSCSELAATCEQNPWETIHILADGRAIVCEVQQDAVMGDLSRERLSAVWNGVRYREFREGYASNRTCLSCAWREQAAVTAGGLVLFRGWHPAHGDPVRWSQRDAGALAAGRDGVAGLRMTGVLPPGPDGRVNRLTVSRGGRCVAGAANGTGALAEFTVDVPVGPDGDELEALTFETTHGFCPAKVGAGSDLRRLGFGLVRVAPLYERRRVAAVGMLLAALNRADGLRAVARRRQQLTVQQGWDAPGLSIVIPERASPAMLARCLEAARAAAGRVREPVQMIVVVNGTRRVEYADLERRFGGVTWIFHPTPLAFRAAIASGLKVAGHGWVYLLNNDMVLERDALAEVCRLRDAETFAVGSSIRMADGSGRETNWTAIEYRDDEAARLLELDPAGAVGPRECLYSGGGCSLFRTELLRIFIKRSSVYDPFYWEDVEWGAAAWREGYRSVFCPGSRAMHEHRQTIGRFYSEAEIERIFERNRLLFHLRNLGRLEVLRERLLTLDKRTWGEIFRARTLARCVVARSQTALAPWGEEVFSGTAAGVGVHMDVNAAR